MRTRANVLYSSYDHARRILTIATARSDKRPSELPYTALIAGPEPTALEGCARVAEEEFTYRDEADKNRAMKRGIVVSFHPGTTRIHYGADR